MRVDIKWLFTAIAFTGVLLNIGKKKLCFVVWGVSNTGFVITSFLEADYAVFLLFIGYNITSAYGYWKWRKDERTEKRT